MSVKKGGTFSISILIFANIVFQEKFPPFSVPFASLNYKNSSLNSYSLLPKSNTGQLLIFLHFNLGTINAN